MIIIIGDSWGVGEFNSQCNLSGPGFGQYLMLHDRVVNLSVGASSNTQSIDRLQNFLSKYRVDHSDTIYWIVTCPTRCVDGPRYFVESDLDIMTNVQNLLYHTLDRGDQLAKLHQTRIHMIGGLCDLDWLDVSPWTNINIRVPSWSMLINPDHSTGIIYPGSKWWTDLGSMLKTTRPERMQEWLTISNNMLARHRAWQRSFPTDGAHPDRYGHRKLRDHLYPEWHFQI